MAACPGRDLYRQMNRSLLRAPLTFCDGGVWCPSPIGSGYCILVWSTSGVKPLIGGCAERDLFYTTRAKLPNTTACVFPSADSIAWPPLFHAQNAFHEVTLPCSNMFSLLGTRQALVSIQTRAARLRGKWSATSNGAVGFCSAGTELASQESLFCRVGVVNSEGTANPLAQIIRARS